MVKMRLPEGVSAFGWQGQNFVGEKVDTPKGKGKKDSSEIKVVTVPEEAVAEARRHGLVPVEEDNG